MADQKRDPRADEAQDARREKDVRNTAADTERVRTQDADPDDPKSDVNRDE